MDGEWSCISQWIGTSNSDRQHGSMNKRKWKWWVLLVKLFVLVRKISDHGIFVFLFLMNNDCEMQPSWISDFDFFIIHHSLTIPFY